MPYDFTRYADACAATATATATNTSPIVQPAATCTALVYTRTDVREVPFEALEEGDVFRLRRPDGTTVADQGATLFLATGPAVATAGAPVVPFLRLGDDDAREITGRDHFPRTTMTDWTGDADSALAEAITQSFSELDPPADTSALVATEMVIAAADLPVAAILHPFAWTDILDLADAARLDARLEAGDQDYGQRVWVESETTIAEIASIVEDAMEWLDARVQIYNALEDLLPQLQISPYDTALHLLLDADGFDRVTEAFETLLTLTEFFRQRPEQELVVVERPV